MMKRHIENGFTLFELMIVLAIVSILSAVAVPSLRSAFVTSDISSISSDLVSSLQMARLEAVKRISQTTVKANGAGENVSWAKGFSISQKINKDGTYEDTQLRNAEATKGTINISSTTNSTEVSFDSRGYANQAHRLEICDSGDSSIEGRRIVIAASGHVTSEVFNCNS